MATLDIITLEPQCLSSERVITLIKRNQRGWKLFFKSLNSEDTLLNHFWGYSWDGSAEHLKEIILKVVSISGSHKYKHFYLEFVLNGKKEAVFSSKHKALYSFRDTQFYPIEPKITVNLTNLIHKLF